MHHLKIVLSVVVVVRIRYVNIAKLLLRYCVCRRQRSLTSVMASVWFTLFLVLPVEFGHVTACRCGSLALFLVSLPSIRILSFDRLLIAAGAVS